MKWNRVVARRLLPRRRRPRGGVARDVPPAVLALEVGDEPAEDLDGIGHRPPPHSAVTRLAEGLYLHVDLADPPELVGEGGNARVEVRGVGEHDEVRRHPALVLLEEAAEVL